MAATLKVPTTFTAIDKVTKVVDRIQRSVSGFASKAEASIARGNRMFRKFTPALSDAGRQMLDYAKSAALAGGIIASISFSAKAVTDYETAVASFKTIVSDLNSKEFNKFKKQIASVATETKSSTIDVANSFEKIAGLNSSFAKTADGLGLVSKASIILSRASGDDLATAADNLVGIMNQFDLKAKDANRAINVLAAGQAVGAASISETSESFKNFGAVAKGANISIEQSVGLIELLAAKQIKGAEAGTALRGSVLRLQKHNLGYKSGVFSLNDALEEMNKKTKKLRTSQEKDAYAIKIFGAENVTAGKILTGNIPLLAEFTKGVTGTSEAQKAAAINSDTFTKGLGRLKDKWVTLITSSDSATNSLGNVKKVMAFVTDNMETIVSVGAKILLFFAAWKALLIVSEVVLGIYNIALGINGALTGVVAVSVGGSAAALAAYNIVSKSATAAQWLWNAAMTANPIGLIIVGIAALIALVVVIIKYWDDWGAALSIFMGPLGMVISLVQSFRRNWDMIKKAFSEGGIIEGLKAIGRVILDALLQPAEQLLNIIANLSGFEWAKNAAAGLHKFRASMGVSLEPNNKPALSTPAQKTEEVKAQRGGNNNLNVNFNDPFGAVKNTQMSGPLAIPVKVTPTNGRR